ncbi:hypothetical protein [Motilimonas eburnea]|uniref:hypothetical protein n=1 Tax=Motilimonas eburnea TaxID=1737488 RepID=UPI001E5F10BC|nr:hypothetical protein [Motilimonas eburnea]MCE2570700.1 hypothetical protein [Motilimonas eburnea]
MTSILSNTQFALYASGDINSPEQDIQQQAFGKAVSAVMDELFSSTSLTPSIQDHLTALQNRAETNDQDSIELLHNLALKNDAVGKAAEQCLYQVYSGVGRNNGADITIEQTARAMLELTTSLDENWQADTSKLTRASVLTLLASGDRGQPLQPMPQQMINELSANPDEANHACQQLNLALRTCYSEDQITDDLISLSTREAKEPGQPISSHLLLNGLNGASVGNDKQSVVELVNLNDLAELKERTDTLAHGDELVVPVMVKQGHYALVMLKKSEQDETISVSVFDSQYASDSEVKANYDSLLDQLALDETKPRNYLMAPIQDANDCSVHCALFLAHYNQQDEPIETAYANYKLMIELDQENDLAQLSRLDDAPGASVSTSSNDYRNRFMALCCDGLMQEYFASEVSDNAIELSQPDNTSLPNKIVMWV